MFKLYQCGCVGFVTRGMVPAEKKVWCFEKCQRHPGLPLACYENLTPVPSRKLTDDEIEELFGRLSKVIADGKALAYLRDAVRMAGLPR
jgi:hypothetical protein